MAHEVPPTPRCHLPWKSLNLRPELSVAMDSLPIHAQLASEMTTMDYLPFPAQQYDGYAEYLQELEAGSHGEQAEEMARLRDRLNQMAQRHADLMKQISGAYRPLIGLIGAIPIHLMYTHTCGDTMHACVDTVDATFEDTGSSNPARSELSASLAALRPYDALAAPLRTTPPQHAQAVRTEQQPALSGASPAPPAPHAWQHSASNASAALQEASAVLGREKFQLERTKGWVHPWRDDVNDDDPGGAGGNSAAQACAPRSISSRAPALSSPELHPLQAAGARLEADKALGESDLTMRLYWATEEIEMLQRRMSQLQLEERAAKSFGRVMNRQMLEQASVDTVEMDLNGWWYDLRGQPMRIRERAEDEPLLISDRHGKLLGSGYRQQHSLTVCFSDDNMLSAEVNEDATRVRWSSGEMWIRAATGMKPPAAAKPSAAAKPQSKQVRRTRDQSATVLQRRWRGYRHRVDARHDRKLGSKAGNKAGSKAGSGATSIELSSLSHNTRPAVKVLPATTAFTGDEASVHPRGLRDAHTLDCGVSLALAHLRQEGLGVGSVQQARYSTRFQHPSANAAIQTVVMEAADESDAKIVTSDGRVIRVRRVTRTRDQSATVLQRQWRKTRAGDACGGAGTEALKPKGLSDSAKSELDGSGAASPAVGKTSASTHNELLKLGFDTVDWLDSGSVELCELQRACEHDVEMAKLLGMPECFGAGRAQHTCGYGFSPRVTV